MTGPDEDAERAIAEVGRDPGRNRLLRTSLRVLADGEAGPELQEMARSVLEGTLSLREALLSSAYSGALRRRAEQGLRQLHELPADEREALLRNGRQTLDRMAQQERDENGSGGGA